MRKIRRVRPGLNPRTEASMLTTRPPKPMQPLGNKYVRHGTLECNIILEHNWLISEDLPTVRTLKHLFIYCWTLIYTRFLSPGFKQPPVGQVLLICGGYTITLRHTALGRTPLDGWSARRRRLYLRTHDTHKRQIFITPARFEHAILATEDPLRSLG
jgi:hypothetical protein